MSNPFLGELKLMSFIFPPRGWALCNGQLLSIAQNQALFSLLGTNFGGNGTVTFGLPNLQDRFAMGPGTGPGVPTAMAAGAIGAAGGGQPHANRQPYLGLQFCIALQGVFPPRS